MGNRYELIEKIGGGGMAVVYKAKCRLLDRFVAVKILRSEFINDEEFVKRFRIEAQAAASLSHPNIVSIYDVGQEDSIHYIVMEYIDGVTLKDYISRKSPLNWKDAVNISIQICSAIEQAHKHHIVHRDIKPHNILLTKDGIAKVTDFGIARAVSSSTITMVGSTIGSVHYFSPEQARGGYIDEKSDLYSLGVALYEMVTGKVPFDGETPVAIALKHIQAQAVPPVELNRSIPRGVNDIIMKAIRKEQSQRYPTASDMLSDLYRVLREPNGDFAAIAADGAADSPTKRIQALNVENLVQEEGYDPMKEGKAKKNKRKDRYTIPLAVFTSIIIMLLVGYITYKVVFPNILPPESVFTVQNYVGRSIHDVKAELSAKEIKFKEKGVFNESVEKDIIISQSIEEGQVLKGNGPSVIEFEVSKGQEFVVIPDYSKKDYRTAEADLKDKKLLPKVEEEFNDTIGVGLVVRTDPVADEEVKPGTTVVIYKSKGPKLMQVKIPDFTEKTRAEAQKLILDMNLRLGKMDPESGSDTDRVYKQYPAVETMVDEGTPVDLWFNDGSTVVNGDGSRLNRKYVTEKIELEHPEQYEGSAVKIKVEATPSDTGKAETILNEKRSKDSFPVTVSIPVPEDGTTKVRVFLDNKFFKEVYR